MKDKGFHIEDAAVEAKMKVSYITWNLFLYAYHKH